jgi:hypothetical protein
MNSTTQVPVATPVSYDTQLHVYAINVTEEHKENEETVV